MDVALQLKEDLVLVLLNQLQVAGGVVLIPQLLEGIFHIVVKPWQNVHLHYKLPLLIFWKLEVVLEHRLNPIQLFLSHSTDIFRIG